MAKKGKMRQSLNDEGDCESGQSDDNIIVIEDSLDSIIDVDLLYAHQETFFGELRCAECGQKFESAEQMTNHNGSGECNEIESICHVCMKVIKGHDKFLSHIKTHEISEDDEMDGGASADDGQPEGESAAEDTGQEEMKCPFCGEGEYLIGLHLTIFFINKYRHHRRQIT